MSLDYQLSPDSPLLHPDAPERVFGDPGQYVSSQRIKDLHELGRSADQIFPNKYCDDITAWPVYSVLTHQEIAALLTPAGTVWVLSQVTELALWEASRLYESGIPWPLRPHDDDLQWARGVLTQEQIDYLSRPFQPVGRQGQIIIELEHNGWEPRISLTGDQSSKSEPIGSMWHRKHAKIFERCEGLRYFSTATMSASRNL